MSAGKVLVIVFFDCHGPIYRCVVSSQKTINAAYYRNVLQQLLRHIHQKRLHFKDTDSAS